MHGQTAHEPNPFAREFEECGGANLSVFEGVWQRNAEKKEEEEEREKTRKKKKKEIRK